MGNNQDHEKRLGIIRLRPAQEKLNKLNVEKHHMQRARGKAIKVSINTMILMLQPIKVIVREREVMEATHDIALYIQNKVSNLPNDEFKRWPMSKVFSTLSISNLFPNIANIQAFKSIMVQNEIVIGW
jgi:hypothetical protein